MRAEDIFEALTDISDQNLETKSKKRRWWLPLTAMAAVLALAVGLLPRMGGMSSKTSGIEASVREPQEDGATAFMSYAGPVFPLTAMEDGLSAVRDLTWDFSPWKPVWYSIDDMMAELPDSLTESERAETRELYEQWYPEGGYERTGTSVLVTDSYTLSAAGDYTLVYPFVSSFRDLEADLPTLTQNGRTLDCTLYAGAGGQSELSAWTDYKAVLESGDDLKNALSGAESVTDTPVIVYRLADVAAPDKSDEAVNPTIELSFELDYDDTQILTYGFNGGSFDREAGNMSSNCSVGQARYREEMHMLIVLGEDIGEIAISGYRTGDCSAGNQLEGVSARIVREETTLGAILTEVIEGYMRQFELDGPAIPEGELFYNVVCRTLEEYDETAQYFFEGLEFLMSDIQGRQRVFYLAVPVTAAEGDVIEAGMRKAASFDFYCGDTKNRGVNGYDMVTQLGSSIRFTGQTAGVENFEECVIVGQNLGLDPEKGVFRVELDVDAEHYYLEVRRVTEK